MFQLFLGSNGILLIVLIFCYRCDVFNNYQDYFISKILIIFFIFLPVLFTCYLLFVNYMVLGTEYNFEFLKQNWYDEYFKIFG